MENKLETIGIIGFIEGLYRVYRGLWAQSLRLRVWALRLRVKGLRSRDYVLGLRFGPRV